jgi:hypothetical protein
MSNPEQGPQQQGIVGQWQTISLVVPDFLEPVREAVDAFFSFLIQILNILIAVLEILKVFATGLLDPLIALIEAIRNLIEALLNDLRQLGIYIHGDFYALEGPDFQALKGGYLTYEGRMVGRLQDRQDPNRPDISEFSTCIAVFLFVQTDIRGINRIVQLIKSILGLFNRQYPVPRMQNRVNNIQASYGYDGATIFSFNKSFFRGFDFKKESVEENINNPYNAVNLTWQMAPIPGAPFPDTPIAPPAGFLVEFSTRQQPLTLVAERVIAGSAQDMDLTNQPAKTEVVQCLDQEGNPVEIWGGAQQLDIQGRVNWNQAVDFRGDFKSDAVRCYGIRALNDSSPVALDLLQEGDKYFLQRTFYVPFAQNLFFPGKGFGATFLFEDMPFAADFELNTGLLPGTKGRIKRINDNQQPEQFFVRIRAVNRTIKGPADYQYQINETTLRDDQGPVLQIAPGSDATEPIELNDAGPPSDLTPILFPDASTQLYLRAVSEALAIMALSRADLPVLLGKDNVSVGFPPTGPLKDGNTDPYWGTFEGNTNKPTQLEEIAKFMLVQVVGRRQIKKFFEKADSSPAKFRKKLFINCINLTNRFLTKNLPPLPARQLAVDRAEDLLNLRFVFGDETYTVVTDPNSPFFDNDAFFTATPMELLQDTDPQRGLGPNPYSIGVPGGRVADRIRGEMTDDAVLARAPHFFYARAAFGQTIIPNSGRGSYDNAPVVYSRTNNRLNKIDFFRNLIPDEVYEGARFVLQVAAGPAVRPQERGWIAFRVFPQGIPSIDRFFDQIIALLRSIQAAIESIAETIVRYIEFLQSRLRELQAFLNRLNALIQRLLRFFFSITPAAGLVVVAPGTDGVTTALLASTNKPILPENAQADSYGGGIVLFAGGIPNLAIDVFRALFQGDT